MNLHSLMQHSAPRPEWLCERCETPWPCERWRSLKPDTLDRKVLVPFVSGLLREAISDLRGRPEGPEPPEIVKRFLWFMPLTDEEARAIALRMR